MAKQHSEKLDTEIKEFDLSQFETAHEAEMEVTYHGTATGWRWRFAGPGHPNAVAQRRRLTAEQMKRTREIESARINGRRWVPPHEEPEDVLERNIVFVTERLLGWSEVTNSGKRYDCSIENIRAVLADPRKEGILLQALEFLGTTSSFVKQ